MQRDPKFRGKLVDAENAWQRGLTGVSTTYSQHSLIDGIQFMRDWFVYLCLPVRKLARAAAGEGRAATRARR